MVPLVDTTLKLRGHCQGYFTKAGLEGWGEWNSQITRRRFVGEWRGGKRYWGHWIYPNGARYLGYFKDGLEERHGEWWNANGEKCRLHDDGYLRLVEDLM
jgi:hypothetical protein